MPAKEVIEKIEQMLEKASSMHIAFKILLIATVLIAMFFPGIHEYLTRLFDPHYYYRDELLFLPPFYKYMPEPIPSDYIKEYYLNVMMAPGFKAIMAYLYSNFDMGLLIAPIKLINLILMIILVGIVAWQLGGALACFSSMALLMYAPIFFDFGLNGFTPRLLVYPFMVLSILFMMKKRIYAMALLVIAAALIYPQSAFLLGIAMAIWLLFVPKNNLIAVNNWHKKIAILAASGFITAGIAFQQILAASAYGRRMTEADIPAYPEIGQFGVYGVVDSLPYSYMLSFFVLLMNIFTTNCSIYVYILLSFGSLYVLGSNIENIYREKPKSTAIFVLLVAGLLTSALASIFSPYLYIPVRYLVFSFPLFFIFIVPIALSKTLGKLFKNQKILPVVAAAVLIGAVSMTNIYSSTKNYLIKDKDEVYLAYNFIKTQPRDAVFAGWPVGLVLNVPIFSQRNVFIARKIHDVFLKDGLEEMRRRVYAIMDVYFSKSIDPLLSLRDNDKITHFIIDKQYISGKRPLEYCQPFDDVIKEKLKIMSLKDSILVSDAIKPAIIYDDEYFSIIDLSKL